MGYNKATVIGNLGKDPILRKTGNDKSVANFSVCANERFGSRDDGTPIEKKEWFRCVAWGAMAETINKNFQKGRPIFLEGRMQTREYSVEQNVEIDLDGRTVEVAVPVTRVVTELIVSRFEFIDEGSKWGTTNSGGSTGTKVKAKVKEKKQETVNDDGPGEEDYGYVDDVEVPF